MFFRSADARIHTHEDLTRRRRQSGSSDRSFGVVVALASALLALAPLRHQQPVRVWPLVIALLLAAAAAVKPQWLRPLNIAWTRLGSALAVVVTPVVMALMFFVLFTPIAVVLRWMARDPLRLKADRAASTYWIERHPPGPARDTMNQQF